MECSGCRDSETVLVTRDFFACSVCLAVYCPKHEKIPKCFGCHEEFDAHR